jgi:3-oxoacyl-[acyl-carrier protein] reductase
MSEALKGRNALVTGASRGIGREIALELARQGADVVLADLVAGPAEEAVAEIRALGRKSMALSLDVSDLEAVERAAGEIEGALGKVSILVNNAGITRDQLLLRMKKDDWSNVLRVNLDGTFHCTKVFVKDMVRARWGRVINISSVVGKIGNAGQTNYAASKAGVIGFTRSVAREVAGRSVTANAIAPGFIETAMTDDLPEEVKKSLLDSIPLGRLGTATDVAKVVAFLSNEDSGYITGQVIHVDGGMVMA